MEGRIEKLLEVIVGAEREVLITLKNAADTARQACNDAYDEKKYRAWKEVYGDLAAKVDALEAQYLGAAPAGRVLANVMEVVRFLQAEGYKVGRQSVYNAREAGLLITQPDGTVTESNALAYAAKKLRKVSPKAGKPDKVHDERAREELETIRLKRAKLEFEFEKERGKYLLKSDVRAEIAIKIAAFEAGVKHCFRTCLADWILRVGGKPYKAPMLLEMIYREVDQLLNDFGRMEDIGVIIAKASEDFHEPAAEEDLDGGIFGFEDQGRPAVLEKASADRQADLGKGHE